MAVVFADCGSWNPWARGDFTVATTRPGLGAPPRRLPKGLFMYHARRCVSVVLASVAVMLAIATGAAAQGNPTGTISGHVVDPDGLAVPGVTVTVASSVLQGVRTTTTSPNGDYIIPFLPAGD